MCIRPQFFAFALVVGCPILLSPLAHADPVTNPAASPAQVLAARDDVDLSLPAELQTPITIEAKAQTLSEFLASVSAQQSVALKVSPEALPTALVTVHLENYSLSQLMLSLQRLYNYRWSRVSEREYVLDTPQGTALDSALGQLGDLSWLDVRQRKPHLEESAVQWMPQVLDAFDRRDLQQPNGVAWNELPAEIQQGVRNRLEMRSRISLLQRLAEARVAEVEEYPIEISPRLGRDQKTIIDFQITVNDKRGTWSFPVFQATEPPGPKIANRDAAAGGQ